MGIVFKQSFRNTVFIYLGFLIGGINTLFLYTSILEAKFYGLVTFILSSSNLLMPLTAFGVQYAIIKFYSSYQDENQKDGLLFSALFIPLFIALPIGFIGALFYKQISLWLSQENAIIEKYTYLIYIIAVLTAYFEIFYAWAKVQMQSVFGNAIREIFTRLSVMILLGLVFFKELSQEQFIYFLTGSYVVRMLLMMGYAFSLRKPKLVWKVPDNFSEIIKYALYIFLAGAAGSILLDIDKFMIPGKLIIDQVAIYAVGLYIGSVIESPGRAMQQIVQPLTAKAINRKNETEVAALYKKSHINLLLISGLIYVLVLVNIQQLYHLVPKQYSHGFWVVLMIATAKLYHMFLGNNGAIISNSKYYRILLPYAIVMALTVIVLNYFLIDRYGINGAALSTLITVLLYNSIKLWYVYHKFHILPYTGKTLLLMGMIVAFIGIFFFWDFPWHPIINIALKSLLVVSSYLFFSVKLHIAPEAVRVWEGFRNRLKR